MNSTHKIRKDNTSGHKGVSFRSEEGKWVAQIQINRKKIHLGYFADLSAAIKAYEDASSGNHKKITDCEIHRSAVKKNMSLEQSLEAIEQAPRGSARVEALTQHLKLEGMTPGILDTYLMYVLHPGNTFGVADISEPEAFGDEPILPMDMFLLAQNLASRNLSGHAARDAIQTMLLPLNPISRKWAIRFFRRDMRMDMGLKDANKALKANNMPLIPIFEVPLAKKYSDVKKYPGDWAIQPKYDGGRVVVRMTPDGDVTLLSRTGKEWKGFRSIKKELREFAQTLKEESWLAQTLYFDGEIVTYVDGKINFQVIQRMFMRDDDLEIGELQYVVFDVATEAEWFDSQRTYRQRYSHAELLIGQGTDKIRLVPSRVVSGLTHETLEGFCEEFTLQDMEGAMARQLDVTVALKRSSSLVKCKTFVDGEFEIYGMIEGEGKFVGMMGTLQCRMVNGKEFEIGTGFTDKDREDFWDNKEEAVGQYAHCRYQGLTDGGVPRIPSFKGIRNENDFGQKDE